MKTIRKKILILTIVLGLLGLFQAGISIQADQDNQVVTYEIDIENYIISSSKDGDELTIEGFGHNFIMGTPDLPSKIVSIAVPPQAIINDISIKATESVFLEEKYNIVPCQIPEAIDGGNKNQNNYEDEYNKNYLQTYGSDNPYPILIGEYLQNSNFRRYDMVDVRINPFTYYPISKTLEFHKHIIIEISYEISNNEKVVYDYLKETEQFAEHIIANYDHSQQWYSPIKDETKSLYNYVIITLDSLTSSVQPLVDWEESKGRTVNVVTTSWIDANYDGYDLQEKMRNFLREKYPSSEWGIEFLLLAGHYDDVPIRRCAQDVGYGQPETDYYYAELSLPDNESWDQNENHQYGESSDSIDYFAEINVGRIPWSDPVIMEDICEKTVAYEQNDNPNFKKNILLLGTYFWSDTDNAELMEEIAGNSWMDDWSKTRMYEQPESSYPSDMDCNYDNVEDDWSSNTYSFVNWAGHGSPTACYELYPEQAFVDTITCNSLNDNYPSIIFADACSNQDTDENNIGRAMMQQGAVGFLGSTKVAMGHHGWNSPYDGSSQSFDYFFTSKVTSGEYTTGGAHQWALSEMYSYGVWNYNDYETFEWGAYLGNPDLFMFLPAIEILFPDGLPTIIDPDISIPISVIINEMGDSYIPDSGLLRYRFDGGIFQTVSLTHLGGNMYEAILPPASCGDSPEFYFSANTASSGIITSPTDAPSNVYSCLVGEVVNLFSDDFEIENGWTVTGDTSVGEWDRGTPINDNRGDPQNDYDGSGQCYITGNSNDEDIDDGTTWLISPTINVAGEENVIVHYALWYTNNYGDDPNNDLFKTYISNDNGENWVLAETIGPDSTSGWNIHEFIIDDFVSPTNQVKVRFEASGLNSGSVVEAGIDDFTISLFECGSSEPILAFNPQSYNFGAMDEGETDSIIFEIWNAGIDTLTYTISESESWLDVSPGSGDSTGEHDSITVDVDTTGLSDGSYFGEIMISSNVESSVFNVYLLIGGGTEILDVVQSLYDRGFPIRHAIDGDWAGATDFTQTLGVVSSIDLWIRVFGTPEFDLTVELRSGSPDGVLIDSVVFNPGSVPSSWNWLHVDFADTVVGSGVDYFITIPPAPSGVTTSFGYEWGYEIGNPYSGGAFWFTRDGGGLWRDLPDNYEFSFRTYGYD